LEGGTQTYLFYTIKKPASEIYSIGMFEILIDENLEDTQQLILDYGELGIPEKSVGNDGHINIGTGGYFLLTAFESFT